MSVENKEDFEILSSIDKIKQRHYSFLLKSLNKNLKSIDFNDPVFEKIYIGDKKELELEFKIAKVSNDLSNHLIENTNVNLNEITKFFQLIPEYLRLLIFQYTLDNWYEESTKKIRKFVIYNSKDFLRIRKDL